MKIVIRVDAASDIGRGHIMRCLSLAQGLQRWDCLPIFICRELPGDAIALLRSLHYSVYSFSNGDDAEQTLNILNEIEQIDTLIVDHYGLDEIWEKKVRPVVSQLVAIDDLANRKHDCDVLIDPSLGRTALNYQDLVPAHCQLLLGPSYALLSDAYTRLRYSTLAHRKKTKTMRRIFVSMGGTDPNNATSFVLNALSQVEQSLSVDVVIGSEWKQLNMIKENIEQSHHAIKLHVDVMNLAELMCSADLAVGAGGVTAYERCCLGLPTVLLTIADNQCHNANTLHHKGAVLFLGDADDVSMDVVANTIRQLIQDLLQWQRMSEAAATVCDGYGVNRVVSELLLRTDAISLRAATLADLDLMFAWQKNPSTRQYARNTKAPSKEEHSQWFLKKLNNPDCLFNIMMMGKEAVGVLRLDRFSDKDNTFEISILVAPEYRKKGIAASALRLSRKLFPNLDFYAEVHADNTASHQLFLTAGYRFEETAYINRGMSDAN